ncbi:MAG: bifunctional riboflavin kinase/FAD synthetase [Thermoleophilia bacterium]|nr:bifunctional riboflavin kinase/FAD synthetase [Thermoleophilia bacterium]
MRRFTSLGDLPLGGPRRVVALGTFDGVHLGHQAIIGLAIERARERGVPAMVVTFEPNPIAVLRPELRPAVLTEPALKAALIERLGADELLVVPFTRSFARIRADRFAEMLISAPIGADVVVVGENFRFGHGGAGTLDMLRGFGPVRGLEVLAPPMVSSPDGKPISSTRIRRLVSLGQVAEVAPLLCRPHSVEGVVVPGEQRGRALGLPTANVELHRDVALPGRGVYAGRAVLAGGRHAAAVNIGYAPTFTAAEERPPLRLEAFLLDYPGHDLYGQRIRVEFLDRLRDEQRFDSPAELVAQVQADVARTRELAAAAG